MPLPNLMLTGGLAATDANLNICHQLQFASAFHTIWNTPFPLMFRNLKFKMKSYAFFQKKVPHKTWSGREESFPPPRSFDFGKSDDPRKPKRKSSMEKLLLMCYLIRWFVYNF
jgi:hypothetical protein